MWSLCLHLRECIICWINGVLQRGNAVSFLTICDTSCTILKCNATDHNIPHERERERVARMCSAAMRTMCATMRGVRVYQENVSTSPFPFPCPLQCIVAYLGQGNKGHQLIFLLLEANPFWKIFFHSAFLGHLRLILRLNRTENLGWNCWSVPPNMGHLYFNPG